MKKQQVNTFIEMMLPSHITSILTDPQRTWKYAVKGGNAISDSITESIVPNIHAAFGSEIERVLVPPVLWLAFEGDMTKNVYGL